MVSPTLYDSRHTQHSSFGEGLLQLDKGLENDELNVVDLLDALNAMEPPS